MTAVSFPNIVDSFKLSMQEFLSSYFDGNGHTISDQLIDFPVAKFVFDPNQIESHQQLVVAILGDSASTSSEQKCVNPNAPNTNLHGVEVRASLLRTVVISSPLQVNEQQKNRKFVDETWGKLYSLLTVSYAELSSRNIFFPEMSPFPNDIVRRSDLIQAVGILRCEVRISFARYNT